MKVRFEQSGGWGNPLGKSCDLDTEKLERRDAEILETLVDQSGIDESADSTSPDARDALDYEITIDKGGKTIRIRVDDAAAPAKLRPLISFLRKRAKPRSFK